MNTITGRIYVGSSVNVHGRWKGHTSQLRTNKHANRELQKDWNQFGSGAFAFVLIEEVQSQLLLIAREQFYLDATTNAYNVSPKAGSGPKPGFKHKPETIAKISAAKKGQPKSAAHKAALSAWRRGRKFPNHAAAMRGRTPSLETRQRMSAARQGRVFSQTTRAKLSASLTGRVITPEARAKISATKRQQKRTAWNKGGVNSPETRAKLSAARQRRVITPETRAKLSAAMTGRVMSPEWCAKISAALKGRVFTPEWRAKISAAQQKKKVG